jgi:hypothetical protein
MFDQCEQRLTHIQLKQRDPLALYMGSTTLDDDSRYCLRGHD